MEIQASHLAKYERYSTLASRPGTPQSVFEKCPYGNSSAHMPAMEKGVRDLYNRQYSK